MQKNDIIHLKIEDMGIDGEGIGKYEGMTFFVKDALIGDNIKARITKLKKNYGYARVEEILESSPYRTEPRCGLHKRCGGCQIQAMDYAAQLDFKAKKVRNNLIRLGGFAEDFVDSVLEPVVGMDEPYRYRNKAQFPIGRDKEGNIVAGFYAARSHDIIPVMDCQLGVKVNQIILDSVISYMNENHIEPYDEKTGKGLIRHVLIRYGFTTEEIMVCLIINGKRLPAKEQLIEKLSTIKGMTSISININTKNTNVILGDVTECIWGQPYITDYIHLRACGNRRNLTDAKEEVATSKVRKEENVVWEGADEFALTDTAIAYHISPQSFYQVNPIQTEKLYSLALEYAGLTGKESVWDLYCGIGTISLFLAGCAGKVYGVEIIPQAIEDAKNNAGLNGITNAEFFVGKAEEVLPEFYEKAASKNVSGRIVECAAGAKTAGGESHAKAAESGIDMLHPDVIVVDPPRKGCDEKCLETMLKMQPKRIVYVSCDSATLARDLKYLCTGGYEIKRVRPVDQFGHTTHVETCVLLSRKRCLPKIEIEMDLTETDRREYIGTATYQEIKDYIWEHYQTKVSHLYIAQIKRKCGLEVGEAFNKPKSEDTKVPNCPPEKERMIKEALKYFGMIKE